MTKIIDNLQITVSNIHIRYEDKFSTGREELFSVGLTLDKFSAVSTDENWKESFVHDGSNVIHKVSLLVFPKTNI